MPQPGNKAARRPQSAPPAPATPAPPAPASVVYNLPNLDGIQSFATASRSYDLTTYKVVYIPGVRNQAEIDDAVNRGVEALALHLYKVDIIVLFKDGCQRIIPVSAIIGFKTKPNTQTAS